MAYIREIDRQCDRRCGRRATREVRTFRNETFGYYCAACAKRTLAEVERREREYFAAGAPGLREGA